MYLKILYYTLDSTDLLLGDLVGDVCVQQLHHRLAEVARQVVGGPRIWQLKHITFS